MYNILRIISGRKWFRLYKSLIDFNRHFSYDLQNSIFCQDECLKIKITEVSLILSLPVSISGKFTFL